MQKYNDYIFFDDCNLVSGWIHDYYCDIDGAELIFDINNNCHFECPICHKKYYDDKRKKAWVTKYRYKIFSNLEIYSKKYLENKNEDYLKFITDALNYYADNYDKFVIHNKDGEIYDSYINDSNRCGKITAQGLNEASIFMQVVFCIDNINEYISDDLKFKIYNNLFPKVYELLKPQVNEIHNIKCYEICSIGMMGIISSSKDMIEFCFNSDYSFYNQIEKGVTKDYFWYEGSFHYHLYVLKPILNLFYISKKYNCSIETKYYNVVKNMLLQVYRMSFLDCSLPSPNDGWPNLNIVKYIHLYEFANKIFDREFDDIIKNIKSEINDNGTIHMIDSGFSIIKNKNFNVFIKYKDNDISHAHPDKLNIEIKFKNSFLTHDLSTSGYGSIISNDFYKKAYSHNTVVIDGQVQMLNCKSYVSNYGDNYIDVEIENLYVDSLIKRNISIEDNILTDIVDVKCKQDSNIDYFFHCDAALVSKLKYKYIDEIKEYPYLSNIKKILFDKNIILKWIIDNKYINSEIDLENKELYICTSPDNPNSKERTTLLIRSKKGSHCMFKLIWRCL